ncbi:hypothetical protein [Arabiibacter massiliensis]|uniref:hypothetical protein n=1 Tax=Arabiibacter massiliensis TaxID=1870985 RepID=UPI0009B9CC3B|nr:hypothetical protein [Arabiibacter massiliensis]
MMEVFAPRKTLVFDNESDAMRESDYLDTEAFLNADTAGKMRKFYTSCGELFGRNGTSIDSITPSHPEQSYIDAMLDAREVLSFALVCKNASNQIRQHPEEMEAFGYEAFQESPYRVATPDFITLSEVEPSARILELNRSNIEFIRATNNPEPFLADPSDTRLLEYTDDLTGYLVAIELPRSAYALYFFKAIQAYCDFRETLGNASDWNAALEIVDEDGGCLMGDEDDYDYCAITCSLGLYEISARGLADMLEAVADKLFNVHLSGIRTISVHGCQEARCIDSLLTSLWWSALDALREGRLGTCWACGKPFIARNERGKQRRYCDDSCKQWRKTHPGTYSRAEYLQMTKDEQKEAVRKGRNAESNKD